MFLVFGVVAALLTVLPELDRQRRKRKDDSPAEAAFPTESEQSDEQNHFDA